MYLTNTAHISVTGHIIIAATYNFFLPLPVLYSLYPQQAPQSGAM